jgi:hypothetical protein
VSGKKRGAVETVIYRVKHAFKYAGRQYLPGDEFNPQHLRNDKAIIEHHCRTEMVINKPKPKPEKEKHEPELQPSV